MLKAIKFKTKDQKIWFTSDLHINHNPKWPIPLWKKRGFDSLEEHNYTIIKSINDNVAPNDILINNGDITLNCSEEQFEGFISQLNCKNHYLLWGNHNNPAWKIYQNAIKDYISDSRITELYPFYYKGLIFVGNYLEMWVDKTFIVCCHYPLSIHNYCKNGSYLLVGHSHHGFNGSLPSNINGKILDIGWDGFRKPLSFQEVKEIMDTKNVVSFDEHH
ncbi:MAG: hypothetical protein AABY22_01875 [Nanoarchaeota archaeon]